MQNHKTQQFAKFFIKDLKQNKSNYNEDKSILDDLDSLPLINKLV